MNLDEFEKIFPLSESMNIDLKVIIGEQPYKQSLNNIPFAVDGTTSNISIYQKTKNISFLVSDWIKVQDSLEMIFNLMFGQQRSLCALAYLRCNEITPIQFAEFLWSKAKILLLNRHVDVIDYAPDIKAFIEQHASESKAHILFVGKKSESNFPSLSCSNATAIAIHPSGTNL